MLGETLLDKISMQISEKESDPASETQSLQDVQQAIEDEVGHQ